MTQKPVSKTPDSADQDQFLTILSREDALARFEAALFPRAAPSEPRPLADTLGRAMAADVLSPPTRAAAAAGFARRDTRRWR